MADFEAAYIRTLANEGGYSNDPGDSGGPTRYGITEAEARAVGYEGDMREFPIQIAKAIYKRRYWDVILGDEIPDQAIAEKMFDAGVNVGIHRPVEWLQRSLNALNKGATKYADIGADGIMGQGTLAALKMALGIADYYKPDILKMLNAFQAVRYVEIAERNKVLEAFVPGWIRTRISDSV